MLSLAQNRVGEDRVAQDPSDRLPSPPAEIWPHSGSESGQDQSRPAVRWDMLG